MSICSDGMGETVRSNELSRRLFSPQSPGGSAERCLWIGLCALPGSAVYASVPFGDGGAESLAGNPSLPAELDRRSRANPRESTRIHAKLDPVLSCPFAVPNCSTPAETEGLLSSTKKSDFHGPPV